MPQYLLDDEVRGVCIGEYLTRTPDSQPRRGQRFKRDFLWPSWFGQRAQQPEHRFNLRRVDAVLRRLHRDKSDVIRPDSSPQTSCPWTCPPPAPPAPPAASADIAGVVAVVEATHSALLWEALHRIYTRLGLGDAIGGDRAFEQMAAARLIEPTSKARVPRILDNLGLDVSQRADLVPLPEPLCRAGLARGPLSGPVRARHRQRWSGPVPAGVTTLYFETEREDGLSRVGCSKEKGGSPRVIVGLLVDRTGLPLQIGCREGNKAEITTIIPIAEAFQAAHGIEELARRRRPGMLSASDPTALDEASPAGDRSLAGLKGYVTNIPAHLMDAAEVALFRAPAPPGYPADRTQGRLPGGSTARRSRPRARRRCRPSRGRRRPTQRATEPSV